LIIANVIVVIVSMDGPNMFGMSSLGLEIHAAIGAGQMIQKFGYVLSH
jgi:hypothetical protein